MEILFWVNCLNHQSLLFKFKKGITTTSRFFEKEESGVRDKGK